jgi:hypothetical protein
MIKNIKNFKTFSYKILENIDSELEKLSLFGFREVERHVFDPYTLILLYNQVNNMNCL